MRQVTLILGSICKDHVHMYVSISPKLSVSEFMGFLKGKSSLQIFDKYPQYGNKCKRNFWPREYYIATVGNVNEATMIEYIKEQEEIDKLQD